MLDLIAFDADDTLWHNEDLYRDARDEFRVLLAAYDPPPTWTTSSTRRRCATCLTTASA